MQHAAAILETDRISRTSASSRFGGFRPETESQVRTQNVKSNPVLEAMKDAWKECNSLDFNHHGESHARIMDMAKALDYSAKDIEVFSFALAEFESETNFGSKAGMFLSALINQSEDQEFVVHTSHLAKKIDCIGYQNTKKIAVDGDAGEYAGCHSNGGSLVVHGNALASVGLAMKSGSITVDGDAESSVGTEMENGTITISGSVRKHLGYLMKGGAIIVKNDAGEYVGHNMCGGSITIEGHAGKDVGHYMKGGVIHIEGDYEGLSKKHGGGKIYHNQKRVWRLSWLL